MSVSRTCFATLAMAALSAASRGAAGQERELRIDAGHSTIEFEIPFMYSHVRGRFDDVTGSVLLAGAPAGGVARSSAMAIIRTTSINTGSQHRDDHLRSADFFDAARYPLIIFRAQSVAPDAAGGFTMAGLLSMHGVTRSVSLACRMLFPPTNDPHHVVIAGFTGSTMLARRDFGIVGGDAHNPWFDALRSATMGDSVRVTLEIHLWQPDAAHPDATVASSLVRIDSIGIDSAVAHLRTAFARDSVAVAAAEPSLDLIGQALLARGRVRDAFLWLHAVARLLPRSTTAMTSVGLANERMGDTARAIAWYREALAADSLDPRATLRLQRLLGNAGPPR
jgi:polyisoprenoid-binding protein YceI